MSEKRRGRRQARSTAVSGVFNTVNATVYGPVVQIGVANGPVTIHPTGPREAVPVVSPVPGTDQAAPEVFVGRTREIEHLLARLDPDGESGAATVSVVAGMGGVGKTALARRVSATAVTRGWFAGGAVMVDLHGYHPDGGQVRTAAAFGPLLAALGVSRERVPATEPEQAAAYHHLLDALARQGRRVLLVLDNVSSSDQVRDFLPRSAAHRAVVTTRDTLTLPSVRALELDVPEPGEAGVMLERILHGHSPGDPRVGREPAEATRVIEACGRLPLALGIAAAMLADDHALTLAELVDELDRSATREEVLRHGEPSIAPVFDLSWRRLQARDPSAARVLPLLVLNPGPGTSTEAAAALADEPVPVVRPRLRRLRQAHLLYQADGHWRMHDLIRSRVRGRTVPGNAEESDPQAALSRLLHHYGHTATAMAGRLTEQPDGPGGPGELGEAGESAGRGIAEDAYAADRAGAWEWFARERPSLLAAVPMAAVSGHHHLTVDLAETLLDVLDTAHDTLAQAAMAQYAVDAAAQLDDAEVHAGTLHRLGSLHTASGRHDRAATAHREALRVCRAAGDRKGEAAASHLLGSSLLDAGRLAKAVTAVRQAAHIYRVIGHREGEARALGTLARIHCRTKRYDTAVGVHRQAIGMHQDAGDTRGEGAELNNLGLTLWLAGRKEEAVVAYRRSADVSRTAGHHCAKAAALRNLAMHTGWLGRTEEALAAQQEALETCRSLGDVAGESAALSALPVILSRAMEPRAAVAAQQRSVEVCRAAGHRRDEGLALSQLGQVLAMAAGNLGGAIDAHRRAVDIWRDLADRDAEATELKVLAGRLAEAERNSAARRTGEEAVAALNDTGRHAEAVAIEEWLATLPAADHGTERAVPSDAPTRMPRVYTTPKGCTGGCLPFSATVGAVVAHFLDGPWWLVAILTVLAAFGWGTCLTSVVFLSAGVFMVCAAWGTWWSAAGLALLLFGAGSLVTGTTEAEPDGRESDRDRQRRQRRP